MTATLTKTLHSREAFSCETAVAVLKTAFKLLLSTVLAATAVAAVAFAVAAREPVAVFGALALALVFGGFVFELLTGRRLGTSDAVLDDKHDTDLAKRADRFFNPDNLHNPNR